jgi:hypothetical protein
MAYADRLRRALYGLQRQFQDTPDRSARLLRPSQTVLAGRVPEVALGYDAFALINTFGMPAGLKRFQEGNRIPRSE